MLSLRLFQWYRFSLQLDLWAGQNLAGSNEMPCLIMLAFRHLVLCGHDSIQEVTESRYQRVEGSRLRERSPVRDMVRNGKEVGGRVGPAVSKMERLLAWVSDKTEEINGPNFIACSPSTWSSISQGPHYETLQSYERWWVEAWCP